MSSFFVQHEQQGGGGYDRRRPPTPSAVVTATACGGNSTSHCAKLMAAWRGRMALPMTDREQITLNAYDKWRLYGRFPWKAFIAFLLVIGTTAQVMLMNQALSPYARASLANWNHLLAPPPSVDTVDTELDAGLGGKPVGDEEPATEVRFGYSSEWYLYTIPAFVGAVRHIADVYYNVHQVSLDRYDYVTGPNTNAIQPPRMTVWAFDAGAQIFDLRTPFNPAVRKDTYYLWTKESVGPFDAQTGDARIWRDQTSHGLEDHHQWQRQQQQQQQQQHPKSSNSNSDRQSDGDDRRKRKRQKRSQQIQEPQTSKAWDAVKSYIHTVTRVEVDFNVLNYAVTDVARTCFEWKVKTTFDFLGQGRATMTVQPTAHMCPSEAQVPWYRRFMGYQTTLYCILSFLALTSQVLWVRSISRSWHFLRKARTHAAYISPLNDIAGCTVGGDNDRGGGSQPHGRRSIDDDNGPASAAALTGTAASASTTSSSGTNIVGQGSSSSSKVRWEALTWRDKAKFFNIWFVVATLCNVCTVCSCVIAVTDEIMLTAEWTTRMYASGLACMMAWFSIVQFFEGFSSYYVLIMTLKRGFMRVCRFLVGVMPVFFGYALFGVAFFSNYSVRFATVDQASVTLFALLNGDVIHDCFDELYPVHPFISRIYLYSFISLFIYAVLNIFIAIVEDAFFASKAIQLQSESRLDSAGVFKKADGADPLSLLDDESVVSTLQKQYKAGSWWASLMPTWLGGGPQQSKDLVDDFPMAKVQPTESDALSSYQHGGGYGSLVSPRRPQVAAAAEDTRRSAHQRRRGSALESRVHALLTQIRSKVETGEVAGHGDVFPCVMALQTPGSCPVCSTREAYERGIADSLRLVSDTLLRREMQ